MFEPASWLGVTKIETPLGFLYIYFQSKTLDKYLSKHSLCFSSWHFKIPSNTANNINEDQYGRVSFLFHSLLSFKKYLTSLFQTKPEINPYKTFHICYNYNGADGARHHPHRTHDLRSGSQDHRPSTNSVQKTICCNLTSSAPDDGRMHPKHVSWGYINKLHCYIKLAFHFISCYTDYFLG